MLKLFKYLKKSILSILLIIVLLVCQATLDLRLPDYTSKIINIGIGQNGIEDATLEVISESSYLSLARLMSDSERKIVNGSYRLIHMQDKNYINKYPILKDENIYLYNGANREEVNKIFNHVFALRYMSSLLSASSNTMSIVIPDGMSFDEYLLSLDNDTRNSITERIDSMLEEIPESMVTSLSIQMVKNEYSKIGIDLGRMQTNYILISGAKMLGIALLIMIIAISVIFLGSRLAASLAKTLRSKVFNKVMYFSKHEMKKFGIASLITRTTNDIQQVQQVIVMLLRVVFYAPIIAIGGILKTTSADNSMLFIIIIAVAALFILVGTLFAVVIPKFKIYQPKVDRLNLVSREILSGVLVIRAFGNEKHEEERFDVANKDLTKLELFINRTMALMSPLMMLLMNVTCIAIVWYASKGIDNGTIQLGDMVAYIQYTTQIIMSFLMISLISIILPRASVSAKRIIEVIDTDSIIKNNHHGKKIKELTGMVEFKNVSFRYPDAMEDVLTDITFTVNPGEVVAFIGSTGSGKSTLVNLIPRFYDVSSGSILIDGVDIRNMDIKYLRSKIGYTPQKGILFSGSIASNIKYGNDNISDNQMISSAKIAQAEDFILEKDGKYDYLVSQGGTNVSGGQRQRLSIARSIAVNPLIYIFDDSFSALDFKTDAKLRSELKKVTKNSTVFIVAQRIGTIMNADKIVVLDEGKMVGMGTHKELLNNCNVYREIAISQLGEEVVNNG